MIKVLADTNIVIDLLAERHPFYIDAAKLFSLADKKWLEVSVSALTYANTHFILSKEISSVQVKETLRKFKLLTTVLSLHNKIVELALNDNAFADFEDALQYHSAIESGQEAIITRNAKDFKASTIPVMSATEFLASFSPKK